MYQVTSKIGISLDKDSEIEFYFLATPNLEEVWAKLQ